MLLYKPSCFFSITDFCRINHTSFSLITGDILSLPHDLFKTYARIRPQTKKTTLASLESVYFPDFMGGLYSEDFVQNRYFKQNLIQGNQLIFPASGTQCVSSFHCMYAVSGLNALNEVISAGILGGINQIQAGLIQGYGV